MNNELNLLGFHDTNLKQACIPSRADQHREIIQLENPDRVPISVKSVLVMNPVLPCRRQHDQSPSSGSDRPQTCQKSGRVFRLAERSGRRLLVVVAQGRG